MGGTSFEVSPKILFVTIELYMRKEGEVI